MQTSLYPTHFATSTAREGSVCVDVWMSNCFPEYYALKLFEFFKIGECTLIYLQKS